MTVVYNICGIYVVVFSLHVSLVCFHCRSKRYPYIQNNEHENKNYYTDTQVWNTCNTYEAYSYVLLLCEDGISPWKRGDTIAMCSFINTLSCCSLLHSPQTRLFRQLMVACVSSPPCSPCRDNPNLYLWIHGTQCDSNRCCFGMTRTSGNSLR